MGASSETEERDGPFKAAPIPETKTTLEIDMGAETKTKAASAVAGAGAKEHTVQGTDAEATHDAARSRRDAGFDTQMTRDNADINVEEQSALHGMQQTHAWDANVKRTYDWAQTLDSEALIDKRKHQAKLDSMEMRAAEQTLSERQQDHAQRVRFADANASIQIALLADMAEKLGEMHGVICAKK